MQSKHKLEYPNIPSALRTIAYDDLMPVPELPVEYTQDSTRVGRGWDKYKGRPRFFIVQYHTATLDHSS
jgi:hypothetical protein